MVSGCFIGKIIFFPARLFPKFSTGLVGCIVHSCLECLFCFGFFVLLCFLASSDHWPLQILMFLFFATFSVMWIDSRPLAPLKSDYEFLSGETQVSEN